MTWGRTDTQCWAWALPRTLPGLQWGLAFLLPGGAGPQGSFRAALQPSHSHAARVFLLHLKDGDTEAQSSQSRWAEDLGFRPRLVGSLCPECSFLLPNLKNFP